MTIIGVVLVVTVPLVLLFVELLSSRTFVGVLVARDVELKYSFDRERTKVSKDKDGDIKITTTGSNRSTASETYTLTFYSGGKMRSIRVDTLSATVRIADRPDLALSELRTKPEPPLYTHAIVKTEYLVKVRGKWFDGKLIELTPTNCIKLEGQ
jgi:hypothetical protein